LWSDGVSRRPRDLGSEIQRDRLEPDRGRRPRLSRASASRQRLRCDAVDASPTVLVIVLTEAFDAVIYANDASVPPSMLYVYAALKGGVPFMNGGRT
jgi:hypothetical protein